MKNTSWSILLFRTMADPTRITFSSAARHLLSRFFRLLLYEIVFDSYLKFFRCRHRIDKTVSANDVLYNIIPALHTLTQHITKIVLRFKSRWTCRIIWTSVGFFVLNHLRFYVLGSNPAMTCTGSKPKLSFVWTQALGHLLRRFYSAPSIQFMSLFCR